jgi:hypothetical protein
MVTPMSQWAVHPLAGEPRPQLTLPVKARCVAKVDLDGVPKGTGGEVVVASGFNWRRYRVLFDNGVDLGFLDGRHIEPAARRSGRRH